MVRRRIDCAYSDKLGIKCALGKQWSLNPMKVEWVRYNTQLNLLLSKKHKEPFGTAGVHLLQILKDKGLLKIYEVQQIES